VLITHEKRLLILISIGFTVMISLIIYFFMNRILDTVDKLWDYLDFLHKTFTSMHETTSGLFSRAP
jgi:hypothetical protein